MVARPHHCALDNSGIGLMPLIKYYRNFTCYPVRKFMHKYLSGILVLSLFLLMPQTAAARDYAIEMIVFEQATGGVEADSDQDEKWDFSDRKIGHHLQRMATLASRSNDFPVSITLDRLQQARSRLTQAGHRILRTASWIQPSAVYQYASLISLGLANTSLTYGFIRIYKTSLIYADIDLQFSPASPASAYSPASPPDQLPERYFLSEKRRLKFNETHYFDHPKFAVILGIWPLAGN